MIQLLADGGLVVVLVGGLAAGVTWIVREKPSVKTVFPYIVMAGLTSLFTAKIMSFWQPEAQRPFIEKGMQAGASFINNPGFPSDHTLLAVFVIATIFFLTPYKKTSYVLLACAVVMAVARVLALVHTPLDIVGGALAGIVGIIWYVKYKHDVLENI